MGLDRHQRDETKGTASLGLRIAIIISIAFLFPAVVYYGVATFGERPERPLYERLGPGASTEQKQENFEKRERQKEKFRQEQRDFSKTLFWVAVPLGLMAICLGLLRQLSDIGTGFVFAGIITVAEGHFGAWRYIDDELRFFSLLIGLALILIVGYRRLFTK